MHTGTVPAVRSLRSTEGLSPACRRPNCNTAALQHLLISVLGADHSPPSQGARRLRRFLALRRCSGASRRSCKEWAGGESAVHTGTVPCVSSRRSPSPIISSANARICLSRPLLRRGVPSVPDCASHSPPSEGRGRPLISSFSHLSTSLARASSLNFVAMYRHSVLVNW